MDIMAKHIPADRDGVRIAELDTQTYRQQFWSHQPLTDFWRVGRATERKLQQVGLFTMGDIARCSLGKPHGRIIIREMAEKLSLELFSRRLVTDQLVLDVGYDIDNVENPDLRAYLRGKVTLDRYGRKVPRPAHGSENLTAQTASTEEIIQAAVRLYDRITDRRLMIRRFNLSASHTVPESAVKKEETYEQLDLFTDYRQRENGRERCRRRCLRSRIASGRTRLSAGRVLRKGQPDAGGTSRSADIRNRCGLHRSDIGRSGQMERADRRASGVGAACTGQTLAGADRCSGQT